MIIAILGTAGAFIDPKQKCEPKKDENKNILFQSAKYNSQILKKDSKNYKNSTEFLLKNFNDKFVFIGTACAINFQKLILSESLKNKNVDFETIKDNNLDDIFEKILELLQHNDNIILDITHGFRHQPIMAIFASTLSQFLNRQNLKIIFAKEVKQYKEYTYIYLDDYIEITQISLLLTGFIRTFNFIPVNNMKLLNNEIFENFSKSLLSNDLKGVEKNYQLLKNELIKLQENNELKHISNLLTKVKEELKLLEILPYLKSYQKYILLSKITIKKNYLIVSLAYIFESIREYCSYRFKDICNNIKFSSHYQRNDNVMKTIGNYKIKNKILNKYPKLYKKNKQEFQKVNKIYNSLRELRNDLAHINQTKEFENIKQNIKEMISNVEELYNKKILEHIKL